VRSIPEIDSRYPLWDQPNLMRDVDEGRFYLPDAEEGKRETLITTVVDAQPVQCLRLLGPTFLPLLAAVFTGGLFIFSTFHMWTAALVSGIAAFIVIVVWLWKGTALIPEKPAKPIGLGVTLPLYASGQQSVGWWAMFITMLGDMTAFFSLVFGYFFYWTAKPDFLLDADGPGWQWPVAAAVLAAAAWALTVAARRANRRDRAGLFHLLCLTAVVLALGAGAAALTGPLTTNLQPTRHVYPATVWLLIVWATAHLVIGAVMLLYCSARRAAGRMTAAHDIDITNVTLYWHFAAVTAVITVAVVAGFPLLA
jgi:cytochrome c oxidase subunit I+III